MAKKAIAPGGAASLALARLDASGLDADDLSRLHMTPLEAEQTQELHPIFKPLPALKIDYYDPMTGRPMTAGPRDPSFFRLRYLAQATDLASIATGKSPRYAQLPGSGVCAYFPTNQPNWPDLLRDPRRTLIITEGEFKAACACKYGYPTIGIGGIWNWQSAKLGLVLLPELEQIEWAHRKVRLVFDADFRSKPAVCQAANKLAKRLMERGAYPSFVPLPDVVEGGKTGLDDYLLSLADKNDFADLIINKADDLTISRELWALNDEVLYVQDPGLVLVQNTDQKMSPQAFTGHAYAPRHACERVILDDGTLSMKDVPAAKKWLEWSFRATVHNVTYKPGEPKLITETSEWNMWPGWGVKPLKGDATLFLSLVDHLFQGAPPEDKKWFLQWCAYPLQHPGTKLFTCVALHGRMHGTGKSLLAFTLGRIYGKNFVGINEKDLDSSFTASLANRQLVLIDDVTGSDKRDKADRVKTMITQKEVKINIKFIPEYWIPDCINYFFTSNQPDAFFIEDQDRRYFVHEVIAPPLPDSFYKLYDAALKSSEFAAAVFYHLLHLDTSDFNPNAAARMTQAKKNMIADVKSDLAAWCTRLAQDPETTLMSRNAKIEGDLFTSSELLGFYNSTTESKVTATGMGRELRRAGVIQFNNGVQVRTSIGQGRYFIVRNLDRWARAKPASAIQYLNDRYKKFLT